LRAWAADLGDNLLDGLSSGVDVVGATGGERAKFSARGVGAGDAMVLPVGVVAMAMAQAGCGVAAEAAGGGVSAARAALDDALLASDALATFAPAYAAADARWRCGLGRRGAMFTARGFGCEEAAVGAEAAAEGMPRTGRPPPRTAAASAAALSAAAVSVVSAVGVVRLHLRLVRVALEVAQADAQIAQANQSLGRRRHRRRRRQGSGQGLFDDVGSGGSRRGDLSGGDASRAAEAAAAVAREAADVYRRTERAVEKAVAMAAVEEEGGDAVGKGSDGRAADMWTELWSAHPRPKTKGKSEGGSCPLGPAGPNSARLARTAQRCAVAVARALLLLSDGRPPGLNGQEPNGAPSRESGRGGARINVGWGPLSAVLAVAAAEPWGHHPILLAWIVHWARFGHRP
jgi:hypothetical protein